MTPTHRDEEIEGRSYKEYAYSPVPASSSSAVYDSATLSKDSLAELSNGAKECRSSYGFREKCCVGAEMAEQGSKLLQYVAAAAANLSVVMAGAMLGWTSPVLPNLKDPESDDNPLPNAISNDEGSWIGSLVALGAVFGSFIAGYLTDRYGRKRTLLMSAVPFLLGWVLCGTAAHLAQLYVARLIFGAALAFTFTAVPMYVGEIAETSIRGALGSFLQLFITVGLLFSYAVGPFVSYVYFCVACACLPVLFFLIFMTMPESPYYLIANGEKDAAISALARLRSKTPAGVQKEADEVQAMVDEAMRAEATIMDLFKVKANFKALIYTCALASFQQLTGINVVLFYMEDIFIAAGSSISTATSTIIVGAVQMCASGVTPLVVDRLGRRMLLVISGIGEIVSLSALGLFFYLKDVQKLPQDQLDNIGWLPVVSLVIFISLYSIGWGPLPWAVMGEMFSSTVKSKASGITVCMCWGLAFFITKFTSNIQVALGMHTTFWGFAIFSVLSVLFTVFILPETKGKSLQEIQDELNGVRPAHADFNESGSAKK